MGEGERDKQMGRDGGGGRKGEMGRGRKRGRNKILACMYMNTPQHKSIHANFTQESHVSYLSNNPRRNYTLHKVTDTPSLKVAMVMYYSLVDDSHYCWDSVHSAVLGYLAVVEGMDTAHWNVL